MTTVRPGWLTAEGGRSPGGSGGCAYRRERRLVSFLLAARLASSQAGVPGHCEVLGTDGRLGGQAEGVAGSGPDLSAARAAGISAMASRA